MRVTDQQRNMSLQSRLKSNDARLSKSMEEVVSGSRVNRSSDDPTTHATAARFKTQAVRYENMVDQNSNLTSYFETAETAINSASGAMGEALNIAQQLSSGPQTPSQLSAAAKAVTGLKQTMLDAANTQHHGAAVFGGIDDQNPAFDPTGAFLGSSTARRVQIAPGETIEMLSGDSTFGGANGAFAAITALETALTNGDQAAVGAAIDGMKAGEKSLSMARQSVGDRMNAVDFATNFMENAILSDKDRVGELTDADIASSIGNVQGTMGTMQLALQVTARVGETLNSIFKL